MSLPFSAAQFFDVFRRYNEGVWPWQWVLTALAAAAAVQAWRGSSATSRWACGALAALWLWTGSVYHLAYFSSLSPAGLVFGGLFILQAALLAWYGVARGSLRLAGGRGGAALLGGALVLYALVGYPLTGYALGHRYPDAPTFGAPCPTTIFTFGLLLWAAAPVPRAVLVVPALWAMLGASVVRFGMWEDLVMLGGALLAVPLLLRRGGARRAASGGAPIGPVGRGVAGAGHVRGAH
jgi:hypothetical protein